MNSSYYQNRYIDQSKSPPRNYSNRFDSKNSETFEQLQMLLKSKGSESYSSTTKPDTIVQNNNQIFTPDDSEKLLNMMQRLRN